MSLGFYIGYFSAISYVNKLLHPTAKRFTPQYKIDKKEETISFEKHIPIIYGFNKVLGHIGYREETDEEIFDILVAFGEGEVKSIGDIEVDDVPIAELLDSTLSTPHRGLANQTANDILLKGVYKVPPIADAYTAQVDKFTNVDATDKNYGTSPVLYGGRIIGNYYRAYFKFDLSDLPDIDSVDRIIFSLYGIDSELNKGEMQAYTIQPTAIDAAVFTGAGEDDCTSGGTYTGTGTLEYKVEIDAGDPADPNTFKWSDDGGLTWDVETVNITEAAQDLNNGVTVTFGADTAHTTTDYWTFTAHPGENWTETGLTWNNQPDLVHGCDTTEPNPTKNWTEQVFNVDEVAAKAVVDAAVGASTCTLCVKQNGDLNIFGGYASKESESTTASLNIYYTATKPCGLHNTAYAAINLDTSNDKISEYIPEITAKIEGQNHLWNADTEVYEYNKNPIWILRDYLTNSRYGLGISENDINDAFFIVAAAYCDEVVTTAEGIEEARYECNIVLDTAQPTWNHIQEILATCVGYVYEVDGKIRVKIEAGETFDGDTQTFRDVDDGADLCNIIEGSFSYSEERQEDVPNSISVRYTDPNKDFKEIPVQVDDNYDISLRGKISFEVPIYGVNRQSQASRLARFILLKKQLNKIKARFRISINNCWISLGDVCYITHAVAGWTDKKFRVIQLSEFSNEEIELYCEEYDELIYIDDTGEVGFIETPNIPDIYRIPPVTNLAIGETHEIGAKPYQTQITISWTNPTTISPEGPWKYGLWMSETDNESYVEIFKNQAWISPVVLETNNTGTWYFKVQTFRTIPYYRAMDLDEAPEDSIVLVGESTTPELLGTSAFTWETGVAPKRAIWSAGKIKYIGKEYAIDAGNTTDAYIYFDPDDSETIIQTSATRPAISANRQLLAYFESVENVITLTEGGRLIHGGILQVGTIIAENITVDVLSAITADMGSLTAGSIVITNGANKIWLNDSDDGAINLGTTAAGKANSLIRFNADGTGYVADENLSWDAGGNVTLAGTFTSSATITGGTFQTAASGQRIVLDGANNKISLFTGAGAGSETLIIDDNLVGSRPGIYIDNAGEGGVIFLKNTLTEFAWIEDGLAFISTDTRGTLFKGEKNNSVDGAIFRGRISVGETGDFIRGEHPFNTVTFSVNENGESYFADDMGIGMDFPHERVEIADLTDLNSETLADGDFAAFTEWTDAADFNEGTANYVYLHDTSAGTLTQANADLGGNAYDDRLYAFTYTVSSVTENGTLDAWITNTFASATTHFAVDVNGTFTIYFKSKSTASTADFVISADSTNGGDTFTLDDLSLKEINGGNLIVNGIITGGGNAGIKVDEYGHVGINRLVVNHGQFELTPLVADEDHGITLYKTGGTSARSYIKTDGASDWNWHMIRGGTDTAGIIMNDSGDVGVQIVPSYEFEVGGNANITGNLGIDIETAARAKLEICDATSLQNESLTNVGFGGVTDWTDAGDFNDGTNNFVYLHDTGAGTLTQANGTMNNVGVNNRIYKFVYTISTVTAVGILEAEITTAFGASTVPLIVNAAATYTVYFASDAAANVADFVISATSDTAADTFTIDNVSLKEIIGGNAIISGVITGGGTTGIKVGGDGYVGIDATATIPLSVSEKVGMTAIGGLAVKMTNKTGANTVAGQLVRADGTVDDAVDLTGTDELECFGVFLESGIADGSEAWVVVSGIADVAMEDNTTATRGNWVRTSITEAGYADATNAATPQPINQTHFTEIGHCIETVAATGGGTHILARCILHFN